MLKNLFIISQTAYNQALLKTREFHNWKEGLEEEGIRVWTEERISDFDFLKKEIANSLFLSDEEKKLQFLKNCECDTIAWYHEGTEGTFWDVEMAVTNVTEISIDFLRKVYDRYHKIPWHIVDTERLIIREMEEADLDALYEIYQSEDVTRFTEALYEDRDRELQYIRDYIQNIYAYYGYGVWVLLEKETGVLVGRAGISHRPEFEEAELGFVLGKKFWHQGYATEACLKIMQIAKTELNMDRLQALVTAENRASIQLLKRLGFHYVEDIMLEGESYQRFLWQAGMN